MWAFLFENGSGNKLNKRQVLDFTISQKFIYGCLYIYFFYFKAVFFQIEVWFFLDNLAELAFLWWKYWIPMS